MNQILFVMFNVVRICLVVKKFKRKCERKELEIKNKLNFKKLFFL